MADAWEHEFWFCSEGGDPPEGYELPWWAKETSVLYFPVWVPEGNQSVWGFNQKWYAYQKYRYTIPLSQRIKKAHRSTALAARLLRAHAHTVYDPASH